MKKAFLVVCLVFLSVLIFGQAEKNLWGASGAKEAKWVWTNGETLVVYTFSNQMYEYFPVGSFEIKDFETTELITGYVFT